MKVTTKISCLLLVLLVSSFFVTIKAEDNTLEYYVDGTDGSDVDGDGSNGSPFASLSGALTAFTTASAAATDDPLYNLIINVKKGTYSGNENLAVPFFVNTTIQNSDDEDNTVFFVCDENNAYAFNPLPYGSFQLYWVTIQNCQRAVNVEYLITQDYQDVYIDHVVFQNISLNAIWIEFASSIAVKDSIFQLPLGDAYNAFINVIGNFTSGIDIINNEFQDGSGIQITNMNGGNIIDNTFQNMFGDAGDAPPALLLTGGVWDINDNIFNNISSTQYSAATFYSSTSGNTTFGNFSLNGNTFEYCNTSSHYGGAISFIGVLGEVTDCTFNNNQALLGGAVFLSSSNVTIEKSTFSTNYATDNGGAIDIELSSTLFLYDNKFDSNTAGENYTANSLSCCIVKGASTTCSSQLLINNGDQGDFADQEACDGIQYVSTNEYFPSLASYQYQPFTTPSGSSLWWLWMLISFAIIITIIVVGVAIGAFIYTKKKNSYEAYA